MVNLDSLTSEIMNGFNIESYHSRRLPRYNDLLVFGLSYELSNARIQYNRTVYGVFDYLSDVGGLSSAL